MLTATGGINGIKGLVKTGAGTLNSTGADTYSGTTTVSGGTLLVNGTHSGAGAYDVQSSGILGGAGTITTASNAGITLQAGGKLSPGSASGLTGTLTANLGSGVFDISAGVGALNSQSLLFDLTTTAASDRVLLSNASSALNIGTGVLGFNDFVFNTGVGFGVGVYTLFDTNNAITGTLGANLTGTFGALTGIISFSNANQDIILTVTAVPEPATYGALAGLGVERSLADERHPPPEAHDGLISKQSTKAPPPQTPAARLFLEGPRRPPPSAPLFPQTYNCKQKHTDNE